MTKFDHTERAAEKPLKPFITKASKRTPAKKPATTPGASDTTASTKTAKSHSVARAKCTTLESAHATAESR
jgi:hypothetical protein